MDWLRQIPIGQYVDGSGGWLRQIDPRLKLGWVVVFLLTPVLAGPFWRLGLVVALLVITAVSGLPPRLWWRSLLLVLFLGAGIGLLAMLLPTGDPVASQSIRPVQELQGLSLQAPGWELFRLGPLVVDRRSAELGINSATLIVTVVHSVNLMLLSTPSEDLMWALSWSLFPFSKFGLPVDRLCFQLLLALRFLPLVQEELQNLMRSVASRAVNPRQLGFKASFGLLLAVGERLLANILLRAEQGADALIARGGRWLPADCFRPIQNPSLLASSLNVLVFLALLAVVGLRSKYGAL